MHLAVVLKKNVDRNTVIVMPLTSSNKGDGTNKVNIGIIPSLPPHLATHDSYAVYDQIRTVSVSRLRFLYNQTTHNIVKSHIPSDIFLDLYRLSIGEILRGLSIDDQMAVFRDAYVYTAQIKLQDLFYAVQDEEQEVQEKSREISVNIIESFKEDIMDGLPEEVIKFIFPGIDM